MVTFGKRLEKLAYFLLQHLVTLLWKLSSKVTCLMYGKQNESQGSRLKIFTKSMSSARSFEPLLFSLLLMVRCGARTGDWRANVGEVGMLNSSSSSSSCRWKSYCIFSVTFLGLTFLFVFLNLVALLTVELWLLQQTYNWEALGLNTTTT